MIIEIVSFALSLLIVAILLYFVSAYVMNRAEHARNKHADKIGKSIRLNSTIEYQNPDNGMKTSGYVVYLSRHSQFANVRNCTSHTIHALDFHEINKVIDTQNTSK